jgi:hypothetical protein
VPETVEAQQEVFFSSPLHICANVQTGLNGRGEELAEPDSPMRVLYSLDLALT